MKYNLLLLILWHFIYKFINEPLKRLIMHGEMDSLFGWLFDLDDFALTMSSDGSMLLYSIIAYSGFYYFFPKRNWVLCIGTVIIAFTLPIAVRYVWEQIIYDAILGFSNYPKDVSWTAYARDNYYYGFRYVTFGVAYYLIRYAIYNEREQKLLTIENQKMELSVLRSQINPHFLLNSINNIYSLVYQKSEKSLDAIDTLSGVLKYSLYEQKEYVTVEDELKNVEKIIDLNKLRFDYELLIEMNIDKEVLNSEIPPFMIIPLVENAFKHGNLKDASQPLLINIQDENSFITINVQNSKGAHFKDEVGGIGLENIRKRLALIYPNNHDFQINAADNTFEVTIKIPMK